MIANEEMDAGDGRRLVESGIADAVAFGRDYIATPDLAQRIAVGAPLNEPDPATFYPQPGQDPRSATPTIPSSSTTDTDIDFRREHSWPFPTTPLRSAPGAGEQSPRSTT